MKAIEKIRVNTSDNGKTVYIIMLINKVNELTDKLNELYYEVGVINEWKIEKERI